MTMIVEGFTEGRELLLVKNSKWYNRVLKSKEELQRIPGHEGRDWQYSWHPKARGPIFDNYYDRATYSQVLFQDAITNFSVAMTGSPSGTKYLCEAQGQPGEAYQDVLDACFCEEMFVPLVPTLSFLDGWVPMSDVKKPFDGATCELCYGIDSQTNAPQDVIVASWQEWVSHPGGDGRQNAGPCFVDDTYFPSIEEPLYWRYSTAYATDSIKQNAEIRKQTSKPTMLNPYPRTPEECLPPSVPTSLKINPSEDDDYYITI